MSKITLTVESEFENSSLIGVAINRLVSTVFSKQETWSIELSVIEAVNNIMKHGYQCQSGNNIAVSLDFQDDFLEITITDRGLSIPNNILEGNSQAVFGFDPNDIDSLPEGGMGFALIKQNMDRVDYETVDGLNRLILVKYYSTKAEKSTGT